MRRLDIAFLIIATCALICGVSLGIWMGIAHDFQFAPVHAHLNLLGWVSLAIFGLTYRAYPRMAETGVAKLHFMLSAPAAVLFPLGLVLAIKEVTIIVAVLASFAWLIGVVLFLIGLVGMAKAPSAAG